jgi:hypothetical protein
MCLVFICEQSVNCATLLIGFYSQKKKKCLQRGTNWVKQSALYLQKVKSSHRIIAWHCTVVVCQDQIYYSRKR